MHLLVLSAFRRDTRVEGSSVVSSLNAPSGAQCFPTPSPREGRDRSRRRLNAPSGAQCFPTRRLHRRRRPGKDLVSMHLLVLSAFRLQV